MNANVRFDDRYLIDGEMDAINPKKKGTKVAPHYKLEVEGGKEVVVRMRLSSMAFNKIDPFGREFDVIFADRIKEANEFYEGLLSSNLGPQQSLISRQAYAGRRSSCKISQQTCFAVCVCVCVCIL